MIRWAFALWALVFLIALIGLVSFAVTGDTATALGYSLGFLLAHGHQDSWLPMIMAIDLLRHQPDAPVYAKLLFAEKAKFIYPTSSLLAPDLLQRVTGASWERIVLALNWISWCSVWATGLVSWRLFVHSSEGSARAPGESRVEPLSLLWPALALTILFYPLARSYVLGQIQTSLTMLVALALLMWQCERQKTAGLLIGVCCAVKPQWGIVLLWGAVRREWAMTAVGAGVAAGLALVAGCLYGFAPWIEYLSVLSFMSRRGEGYHPNQSINGLMNRILFNGNNVKWADTWPDFHPVVYAVTLGAAILVLGMALMFRRRYRPGVLDLALVILSMTMASPIAWEHHYGILLPIVALLAPVAVAERSLGRYTVVYLAVAFVVAGQRLDLTNRLADTRLNVVQSYLFFAAAMVLVLLYRCLATKPAEVVPRR